MRSRAFRPLGLPIYVARVPAAPFSLLPLSLYLDHSHCLVLAPANPAALPSTRAIPDRDVFYVAQPKGSIPDRDVFYVAQPIRSIKTRTLPALLRCYRRSVMLIARTAHVLTPAT
jgi:hypothetical protein